MGHGPQFRQTLRQLTYMRQERCVYTQGEVQCNLNSPKILVNSKFLKLNRLWKIILPA